MFSHIMIGANDIEASKKFYDAVLGALGSKEGVIDPKGRCFYFHQGAIFGLSVPIDGEPATHGNGSTIGFNVESPEQGGRLAYRRSGQWRFGRAKTLPAYERQMGCIWLIFEIPRATRFVRSSAWVDSREPTHLLSRCVMQLRRPA